MYCSFFLIKVNPPNEMEVCIPWWVESITYFKGTNTNVPAVIPPHVNRYTRDAGPDNFNQRILTQDEKIAAENMKIQQLEEEMRVISYMNFLRLYIKIN